MDPGSILLIHYTAPPVVGGVEAVLEAQARMICQAGFPLGIAAGQANSGALPQGAQLALIPEMDSQQAEIVAISQALESGQVPDTFEPMVTRLLEVLRPMVQAAGCVIVHNVLTKHFNLPLTAALARLAEAGQLGTRPGIAWCHDFSWSSPHSRSKVHDGYPWDLLRRPLPGVRYVTISKARQQELAGVLGVDEASIQVIYNGVDAETVLGLSAAGIELADRLDLWAADPFLLMPVRVTQAKNIELAIRTAAVLRSEGTYPRVVVSGPPDPHDPQNLDYFQELLQLRRELGVEQEVRFVYQSGPSPETPLIIPQSVVGDLLRLADLVFLPSRREGFGMPVLEAGLAGVPVVCSPHVPAAVEIGGPHLAVLPEDASPEQAAGLILESLKTSPTAGLRQRVRRDLTWKAIFERQLRPLLEG